jgi:outer membrane protein assembly factor BamB
MYPQNLYAVTSDGIMHTLGQFLGKDVERPVPFLPANANVSDLIAVNETLYAATINGCGGAPNGIWAIDLANDAKSVTTWKNAASPVGAPAFDSNGTVYVAVGEGPVTGGGYSNAIVALDAKTLQVKDSFTAPNARFASTPTIFPYKGREILAAATKDGRVFLLDTASLGGADHKTPLFISAPTTTTPGYSPPALATWEDSAQNRWVLIPVAAAKSGVAALKVTGDAIRPALQQEWVSRGLVSPSAPIVVNGVAFVLSTGEYIPPTGMATLTAKLSKSVTAVLYALDATTGKELWSSGKTITSFVHSAGLWSSDGQVYVATYNSTVYAFGFAMDRHL